jgi:hypothetical protein
VTMTLRRLRRRCAAMARRVPLPAPFDALALCRLVARDRGRPIYPVPMTGLVQMHGLWIATESADVLFYEQATTPPHQEHIILHELSHLLCNHYDGDLVDASHMRRLLPDLDPEMVRRVLGRTTYHAVEEREAELLASLILRRAKRSAMAGPTATAMDDRISTVFDWHSAPP